MTVEELQEKYFLATGIEISTETAGILLGSQLGIPSKVKDRWISKILKMAEPTPWASLSGVYNQEKKP